jgi:hypothetical protein
MDVLMRCYNKVLFRGQILQCELLFAFTLRSWLFHWGRIYC